MNRNVFISYRHSDSAAAEVLEASLRAVGLAGWRPTSILYPGRTGNKRFLGCWVRQSCR